MKRYALLSVLVLALVLVGSREKPTTIHKWDEVYSNDSVGSMTVKAYQFVISNPPESQQALAELVEAYLKTTPPPGFWNGEFGAIFYRESSVTPIDGKRPEANWWDQSWDVPYIQCKPIDEQVILGARYSEQKKRLRIFFHGGYDRTCKVNDFAIIDIQADGSRELTCD